MVPSSTNAAHICGPIRLDSVMTSFSATDVSPHCVMYNTMIQEVTAEAVSLSMRLQIIPNCTL